MPHKLNARGRHHIPKMRHAVTNWREYEGGLRRRGSLTLWLTVEVIDGWSAVRRSTPGGPATYSDRAIQTCLMLRAAFKLALRQAEGVDVVDHGVARLRAGRSDHSTVSRRSARLESITPGPLPTGPLRVLTDSTGLMVFGAGQWQVEKHGYTRRKSRKLHLGVDAGSDQIVAVTLTDQDTSDESQVGALLEQIEPAIEQVTADDAYDGEPTYQTITAHDANVAVVIPPRQDAIPSDAFETDPTPRDTHLLMIDSLGRLGWQEATGYGRRALVETTMGRYKSIIGDRPRSRGDAARRTEAVVGVAVLNRMLDAARPNSVRRSATPA